MSVYPGSVNDMQVVGHRFSRPRHGPFEWIHFRHMHNCTNIWKMRWKKVGLTSSQAELKAAESFSFGLIGSLNSSNIMGFFKTWIFLYSSVLEARPLLIRCSRRPSWWPQQPLQQPQLHFQLEKARELQGDLTSMDKKFQLIQIKMSTPLFTIFLFFCYYLGCKNANAYEQQASSCRCVSVYAVAVRLCVCVSMCLLFTCDAVCLALLALMHFKVFQVAGIFRMLLTKWRRA